MVYRISALESTVKEMSEIIQAQKKMIEDQKSMLETQQAALDSGINVEYCSRNLRLMFFLLAFRSCSYDK